MKNIALPLAILFGFFLGWFTKDILQSPKTEPVKTVEYKVVLEPSVTIIEGEKDFQQVLSAHAKQGWRLVPWPVSPYLVFER